jgi:hypothetical protein
MLQMRLTTLIGLALVARDGLGHLTGVLMTPPQVMAIGDRIPWAWLRWLWLPTFPTWTAYNLYYTAYFAVAIGLIVHGARGKREDGYNERISSSAA